MSRLRSVDARITPGLVPGASHDGEETSVWKGPPSLPSLVMPGLDPGTHAASARTTAGRERWRRQWVHAEL